MSQRTLIVDLPQNVGRSVLIRGWLNNVRALGKLTFLILRDRSGLAQIVVQDADTRALLSSLQAGSILRIEGDTVSSKEARSGVEIVNPKICVEHPILEVPPIEYYKPEIHSDLEFVLNHRPIALRNRQLQAVFRIQAELAHAYRLYMHNQIGAIEYFPPNILGASSEGGAEFFNVDYFGYSATLAQSSQLYKQIMVGVNERVFALTPFFRAEPSQTTRHLSEGKQFEFEMGFFEHWHEILDIQEGCIKYIVSFLRQHCQSDLETLGLHVIHCPQEVPFPRLTFQEAQDLYYERTKIDERKEPDLSPAAERELCTWALEKHGTELVFVTDWKTEKRPFYAYPDETHPHLTHTFDLLCAGTEITSGGQRRHTHESMLEGLRSKGMDPQNFSDYLSIFKYGMPPHGGFGMGLERLTMTLLKLKNIREASLFPSDTKRIAGNRIRAHLFFGEENIRNEIIRRIRVQGGSFEHLTHAPTPSGRDHVAGVPEEGAIKCLIVRGKNSKKNYQFNLSTCRKLNMRACADLIGENCELEDPVIIKERFGLTVGGIPPFGNLLNLDNYFDERITGHTHCVFNCGVSTESILMPTADLLKVADAKLGRFAKE